MRERDISHRLYINQAFCGWWKRRERSPQNKNNEVHFR